MSADTLDLALRPASFPISIEKWYVDVLLKDGAVCLVYLGSLSLAGVRMNRVTAEFFPPDGTVVRGSAKIGRIVGGPGFLRCSALAIDGERLRFRTAGLSGDLTFRQRAAKWSPSDPFLAAGRRSVTWSVEIPDADVEGRLHWPGGERSLVGRGYRDRVRFDVLPWRFPIVRLTWGRAVAGAHAAVWSVAETVDGRIVTGAWKDGANAALDPQGLPPGVTVGESRVFLDADVASLEGLYLGPLRNLLALSSGDPHETKRRTSCVIAGEAGVGVDETVTWRTRRR